MQFDLACKNYKENKKLTYTPLVLRKYSEVTEKVKAEIVPSIKEVAQKFGNVIKQVKKMAVTVVLHKSFQLLKRQEKP